MKPHRKKQLLFLSGIFLGLCLLVVAIPIYYSGPYRNYRSQAEDTLLSLYLMQKDHFRDHGRYAPVPDGIIQCNEQKDEISDFFPDFRPYGLRGFNYEIRSFDNGKRFIAIASGKPGTITKGKNYQIDQDRKMNW